MQRITLLAEDLLASEEGLCSVELATVMNTLTRDSGVRLRGVWYQLSRRSCCLLSVLSNSVGVQWISCLKISFCRSVIALCFEAAAISGDMNNYLTYLLTYSMEQSPS